MEELRQAVEELYTKFWRNEVTVAASQILYRHIAKEQRRRLEYLNKSQKIKM